MARTRLALWLQEALGLAEVAARTRRSPGAVWAQLEEARWTRRRFLRRAAAAGTAGVVGGALALPFGGCGATPPRRGHRGDRSARREDGSADAGRRPGGEDPVVVVGAGLAGLAAVLLLREAGCPFRLFEASGRIGGRVMSARGLLHPGETVELGAEFIDSDHHAMLRLCRVAGVELLDVLATYPDHLADAFVFGGRARTREELLEALSPLAPRLLADRARVGASPAERGPQAAALDRLSLAEYLQRLGVTGWLRDLFDVAFTTEFGLDAVEQSALYLPRFLAPNTREVGFSLAGDERFLVRGGNDRVCKALVRGLSGDRLSLEHRLEAVRVADGCVRLTFARRGRGPLEVRAQAAVLAVPFTMLRRVAFAPPLPPCKARVIRELGYGTNAKLALGVRSRFWRRAGGTGMVYTEAGFQAVWENGLDHLSGPGGLNVYTGGAVGLALGRGTVEERARAVLPQLDSAMPGARAAFSGRAARFQWPSHRYTLGSYACYRPGQWTELGGWEARPVGPLYFAGEHTSVRHQGYMNGAAATGLQAARAVLARRGRRA